MCDMIYGACACGLCVCAVWYVVHGLCVACVVCSVCTVCGLCVCVWYACGVRAVELCTCVTECV